MQTNPMIQVQIKAAADEETRVKSLTDNLLSKSNIRHTINQSNRYRSERKKQAQEHNQKLLIEWIRRMRKKQNSSPEELAEIIVNYLMKGWNSIEEAKFSFRRQLTIRKVASAMCYQYSPDVNKMVSALEGVVRDDLIKIIAYFLSDLAIHGVHKWNCVEIKKQDKDWDAFVNTEDLRSIDTQNDTPVELPMKEHPGIEALAVFLPAVVSQFDSTSGTLYMCTDSLKSKIESIDKHLLELRTEMSNLSKERDGLVDMMNDLEELNQHINDMRKVITYKG